jgi:hypothetical protein
MEGYQVSGMAMPEAYSFVAAGEGGLLMPYCCLWP